MVAAHNKKNTEFLWGIFLIQEFIVAVVVVVVIANTYVHMVMVVVVMMALVKGNESKPNSSLLHIHTYTHA